MSEIIRVENLSYIYNQGIVKKKRGFRPVRSLLISTDQRLPDNFLISASSAVRASISASSRAISREPVAF